MDVERCVWRWSRWASMLGVLREKGRGSCGDGADMCVSVGRANCEWPWKVVVAWGCGCGLTDISVGWLRVKLHGCDGSGADVRRCWEG